MTSFVKIGVYHILSVRHLNLPFIYLKNNYIGAAIDHAVTHAHLVPAVVEAEAAVTAGDVATGLCLAFLGILATRAQF